MIIGISGQAGSGKDTVANFLLKYGFVKVAFADPLKRIVKDIYAFTDEQLWGASKYRSIPDKRYPRESHVIQDGICLCCGGKESSQCYLTPRYSLQLLGTEYGRHCYENTWVDYGLRTAHILLTNNCSYSQQYGLSECCDNEVSRCKGVVIPDCRFQNEMTATKNAGGFVVGIYRPGAGLQGSAKGHASEAEMRAFSDDDFSYRIKNEGTLEALEIITDNMLEKLRYEL